MTGIFRFFTNVIISLESAFHYKPRKAFFAEAKRVLRPGGTLLIGDIVINKQPLILTQIQKYSNILRASAAK